MMDVPSSDSRERQFARLAEEFAAVKGVERSTRRGFGGGALTFQQKIFAMLVRGQLVVKLPQERVAALIRDELGCAFDANQGKPMKEWIVVRSEQSTHWRALADEALTFAQGTAASKGKGVRLG